jgi:small-conductance mechanosensitive channel
MTIYFDKFLIPSATFLILVVVLLAVRAIALRALHHWAARSNSHMDELIIRAIKIPSIFLCLAIGLHLGVGLLELSSSKAIYITKAIHLAILLSIVIGVSNLSGRLFNFYIQKLDLPVPSTGLAQGMIKGIIAIIGFLSALTILGISIAPMVTALGVGGLAVGLALKDTLENLFAGINLLMERAIRVGDFIRLESGQEGIVTDINWRTTRVRLLANNIVVIPNSKLAQSVITNYYLPEKRLSLLIPVSVSYDTDPEQVERILIELAKKTAGEVPGLLPEPEPFVRFIPGFGDSSLDFTLICQVNEFVDNYLAQHELRKRIFKRFKEEGIEIPFPQRTVHLRQERQESA